MPYRKSNEWGQTKPPEGSSLDWGDPINAGLLSCWLFAEKSGSIYSDLCGRNPIKVDAPGNGSGIGKFGAGLQTNGGGQRIYAPQKNNLDFTGPAFTIASWVQQTTGVTNTAVGGKWNGSGYMLYVVAGGALRVYANGTFITSTATPFSAAGPWYHVAGTWDGASQKAAIFINGKEDTRATLAVSTLSVAAVRYEVGSYSTGTGSMWIGAIDHQRLYTRALTHTEIRRLYTEPFAGIVKPRRRIISAVSAAVASTLIGARGQRFPRVGARHG